MLRALGISKRYGPIVALRDVDLTVTPGEVLAIAGENGSGKSTLVRILAGVLSPDAGEIVIDGEVCVFTRPREALAHGIALVAQEPTAVSQMSVAENILLPTLLHPTAIINRRDLAARARPLLATVDLKADPAQPFASLAAGERALAEVAKALAANPRVLILDEATSRLDEEDVERLFALIERLRGEGTTMIIITHRLREITKIADRVLVLRDGRRVGELARAEISEDRLSTLMVGRKLENYFPNCSASPGGPVLRLEDFIAHGSAVPVSLDVRAGEIVGLAGLVGCGRTELLETVAGARERRGGRVTVNGVNVSPKSPRAALRAGIALVPEDRHAQGLSLDASIRLNVAMGSWSPLKVVNRSAERAYAERLMERLRIRATSVEVRVRNLSGGNQQKVVLARYLGRKPRVLLLDEPTRGIDVGARAEIYHIIGQLAAEGVATLLASSDLLELLGLCDRILVMRERQIVGEFNREDASEESIVLLSGGGRLADVS